jgi:hypothetical protein
MRRVIWLVVLAGVARVPSTASARAKPDLQDIQPSGATDDGTTAWEQVCKARLDGQGPSAHPRAAGV